MTGWIKLLQTCKPGLRGAQTLPALILALGAWLLLAALLLAVGLAVHSEEASANALFQGETASPTTGPITATAAITETPFLPPLITTTATMTPTDTPPSTATPTEPPPTPEPTATWTPTPLPTALPEPTATAQTGASSTARRHYVRGDSNVVIQWGMLVDSLALGISWAWLVVGIFVGVGLPILLVALWVRARRCQSEQE
jgi:hypothetical protein